MTVATAEREREDPVAVQVEPTESPQGNDLEVANLPMPLPVAREESRPTVTTPEQTLAEGDLQRVHDDLVAAKPEHAALVAPLLASARAEIRQLAGDEVRRIQFGRAGDSDRLSASMQAAIARFRREGERVLRQQRWEDLVAARSTFLKGRDPALGELALARAADDVVLAAQMYDGLFLPLGLAAEPIARTAGKEGGLLALQDSIPAPQWPGFLAAATETDARVTFAIDHGAALGADADAASVLRVWETLPTPVSSAATARALLAMPNVGGTVTKSIRAGALLGTDSVPDLTALTAIDASGKITKVSRLEKLVALGGDPVTNEAILEAADGLSEDHLKAFNSTFAKTYAVSKDRWTTLKAKITDAQKRIQVIRSLAMAAPDVGLTHLTILLDNWAAFFDREKVQAAHVGSLVRCGVLVPVGNLYTSTEYGKGCVYTFNLAGGGRISAEWHIHYQADGAKTKVVGAGWKNASQKHTLGVKTFDGAPAVVSAIEHVKKWIKVKI